MSKKGTGLFTNSIMNNIMKKSQVDTNEKPKNEYMGLLPQEQIEKLQNKDTDNKFMNGNSKFLSKNRNSFLANKSSYDIRQNLITEVDMNINDNNQEE